jgi:hypothetical protein
MRIGAIRIFREGSEGPIECRVAAAMGKNRISCDISFVSARNELLALMTGVEMYAAPGA